MADHYIGDVVEFSPRVTGGYVVAVVTAVHDIPLFGVTLDIRVTDGTRYWPPGTRESISADVLL
jgi:hypothetical protein